MVEEPKDPHRTGPGRALACGFAIGSKGYLGDGSIKDLMNGTTGMTPDFHEFDPATYTSTLIITQRGGLLYQPVRVACK